MGQVSGKGGGYYGCLRAAMRACGNRLLVPRKRAEQTLLAAIQDRIRDPSSVHSVLQRIEAD